MDKIGKIRRVIEISLDSSYGDNFNISELIILPTQKYDEKVNDWIPDSFTIFLSLKRKGTTEKKPDFFHFESQGNSGDIRSVTNFLESLLGLECCVDFV